jgi:hypothetical protein
VTDTSRRGYRNASKGTERKYERFEVGFPGERKCAGAWQKRRAAYVI